MLVLRLLLFSLISAILLQIFGVLIATIGWFFINKKSPFTFKLVDLFFLRYNVLEEIIVDTAKCMFFVFSMGFLFYKFIK
jgi:hypothetical protein